METASNTPSRLMLLVLSLYKWISTSQPMKTASMGTTALHKLSEVMSRSSMSENRRAAAWENGIIQLVEREQEKPNPSFLTTQLKACCLRRITTSLGRPTTCGQIHREVNLMFLFFFVVVENEPHRLSENAESPAFSRTQSLDGDDVCRRCAARRAASECRTWS
jgi:hypothetical protein